MVIVFHHRTRFNIQGLAASALVMNDPAKLIPVPGQHWDHKAVVSDRHDRFAEVFGTLPLGVLGHLLANFIFGLTNQLPNPV